MNTKIESRRRLTITINDVVYTTRDDDQEAESLLRLAGIDPTTFELAKVKKNGELHVFTDGKVINLADGDKFVSVIFGIKVNEAFVELHDRHQTGASVKAAAIEAHVAIQPDFVLSEVRPNGEQKVVPDDKKITVRYGDEFWAVPGDDNS